MYDGLHTLAPVDSGGIILSYQCSARCRHCLYASGPEWSEWMDVSDAGRIFQGLVSTSRHMRGFHLAGGEPFLDFERLVSIQKLATEFGIPIEYVETNASWCTDPDLVRGRLERLRDVGLQCLFVSCSPFHAAYIPLANVAMAVKVAYDVFGPNGVILWVPDFFRQLSAMGTDCLLSIEDYVKAVGRETARRTIKSSYSMISGGRAGYNLVGLYEHRPPEDCESDHCHMELLKSGHAHFDPYGNFIPSFCSGISLGDARDLAGLMLDLDLSKLHLAKILAEEGPYALYRLAVNEFGYRALAEGYVGKCHLCVDVRRWIRRKTDEYPELAPAQFYESL